MVKAIRFLKTRLSVVAITVNFLAMGVYAQTLPAGLTGDESLFSLPPVLGVDSLGDSDFLSLDLLSPDSGQDILLLGAPVDTGEGLGNSSSQTLPEGAAPSPVIEFLLESDTNGGAVTPQVLTIELSDDQVHGSGLDTGDRIGSSQGDVCTDSDRDGICDENDVCPATPVGRKVLPSGCHFDISQPLKLYGVHFADDSALLVASSAPVLKQAAILLRGAGAIPVQVVVIPSAGIKDRLSLQRAKAVVDFLVAEGLARTRFTAIVGERDHDGGAVHGEEEGSGRAMVELRAIQTTTRGLGK
jgi:hypothetical protein